MQGHVGGIERHAHHLAVRRHQLEEVLGHRARLRGRHREARRCVEYQKARAELVQQVAQHEDALKMPHRAASNLDRKRADLVRRDEPERLLAELEKGLEAAADHLVPGQVDRLLFVEVARRRHALEALGVQLGRDPLRQFVRHNRSDPRIN